jgi:hypothetical protein
MANNQELPTRSAGDAAAQTQGNPPAAVVEPSIKRSIMAREFDRGTIPGSDVEMSGYQEYSPFGPVQDPQNPWLPKTDWSRDKIIANED